jgi:hypothetical protein
MPDRKPFLFLYKKLNIPFCKINIPIIIQIIVGTLKKIDKIKHTPDKKSIQLVKSFNNPSPDLIIKIIPKGTKI